MSKLMTFHKILPGCEEGNPEAWRAFLSNYTPTALQLFGVYSSWAPEARWDCWRDALQALSANEGATLRGFSHQSEREFLVDLRAFLQDRAATKTRALAGFGGPSRAHGRDARRPAQWAASASPGDRFPDPGWVFPKNHRKYSSHYVLPWRRKDLRDYARAMLQP